MIWNDFLISRFLFNARTCHPKTRTRSSAIFYLSPGVFILRPPTPEEVCTQDDILSGDSFESVELLPRSKAAGPDYGVKDLFKSPKFYVLYLIILILSLVRAYVIELEIIKHCSSIFMTYC